MFEIGLIPNNISAEEKQNAAKLNFKRAANLIVIAANQDNKTAQKQVCFLKNNNDAKNTLFPAQLKDRIKEMKLEELDYCLRAADENMANTDDELTQFAFSFISNKYEANKEVIDQKLPWFALKIKETAENIKPLEVLNNAPEIAENDLKGQLNLLTFYKTELDKKYQAGLNKEMHNLISKLLKNNDFIEHILTAENNLNIYSDMSVFAIKNNDKNLLKEIENSYQNLSKKAKEYKHVFGVNSKNLSKLLEKSADYNFKSHVQNIHKQKLKLERRFSSTL